METELPPHPLVPHSGIDGVKWPALLGSDGALIASLQYQFEQSERMPPSERESLQFESLEAVLRHAVETVPYYQSMPAYVEVLGHGGRLTPRRWRDLPVLTRAEVQQAGEGLTTTRLPEGHAPVTHTTTSGSTGRPVRCASTVPMRVLWSAITLRDHLWHGRDLSQRLSAIRAEGSDSFPPEGIELPNWGPAVAAVFKSGPCGLLSIQLDVATQSEWLAKQDPDYLITYPSNVAALAQHFQETGLVLPRLRQVRTYGELLTPEVRAACRDAWGVGVADMYSSQEAGYIALQCPAGEWYHVQSEVALVEVIGDDGEPCQAGDIGRVVITPLHNYAMPLIRYEVGDYAEVGDEVCPCGRTLPVLNRVMGRARNVLTLPDGRRLWPTFPSRNWATFEAIRQLQLVHDEPDHILARVAGPRPMTGEEEDEFAELLRHRFTYPFRVSFEYVSEVARGNNWKYEDFVSRIGTASAPAGSGDT